MVTLESHVELLPLDGDVFIGDPRRIYRGAFGVIRTHYDIVNDSFRALLDVYKFLALEPHDKATPAGWTPPQELSQVKELALKLNHEGSWPVIFMGLDSARL